MTEMVLLLKDHAHLAGSRKKQATLGPVLKELGSREDEYLTYDNGSLWYARTASKPTTVGGPI